MMGAAFPLVVLVVSLVLGVPIAVALSGAGMFGIWWVTGDLDKVSGIVSLVPYSTVADYGLTTVPMFVLMAYFSASSGLAKDLYSAGAAWLSHVKGGLAMATVVACGVFGAMSGASVAASSVMAQIAYPEMRRHGYSEEISAGSVGVGATLVLLIPPSIAMVIYGIATQTSIGKLLIAGVFPGILVGVLLMVCIFVWVRVAPSHAPKTFRTSWPDRFEAVRGVWPSALLIVCVITALYSGVATPTEVASIGAFLAALIGFAMKRLDLPTSVVAVRNTIKTSIMIFLIMIGANMFGYYMTLSQIPAEVVDWVIKGGYNRWVVMSGIIIAYFVISMFMDEIPLLLLTLPLTFPLITSLGFDPVWFGVMSCMMVCMGLIFPPVGLIAFVVAATAKVDLMKVYYGCSILLSSIIATTILLMIFPEIALWLPNRMR
jgi:tripartite ATP-independent transporter DctM subunit